MKELEERLRDPGFIGNTSHEARGGPRGPVGSSSDGLNSGGEASPVEENHPLRSWRLRDLLREWIDRMRSLRAR